MYGMYGNEKFSNLVYLDLGLNFQILSRSPCSACRRGRVRGLKLTMLPLFMLSHIIGLLSSIEKSFNFYDGFGKSALIWIFKPRNHSGENSLTGWLLCLKSKKVQQRPFTELRIRNTLISIFKIQKDLNL